MKIMFSGRWKQRLASLLLILITSLPASADEGVRSRPDPDEIARLKKIWAGWRSGIPSVDFKGFRFLGRVPSTHEAPTSAEIVDFLQHILPRIVGDSANSLDLPALSAATEPVFGPDTSRSLDSDGRLSVWAQVSFARDPDHARLDTTMGALTKTLVRRGVVEQQYSSGSRQASVYSTHSTIYIPDYADVIVSPSIPPAADTWFVKALPNGMQQLELYHETGTPVLELRYDQHSGFVAYYGFRREGDSYNVEIFQSGPVIAGNGIPVPTVLARLKRRIDPEVRCDIDIFVASDLDVGIAIDPARFEMPVPAATRVVKFDEFGKHKPPEAGGSKPPIKFIAKPVEDAAKYTESSEFTSQQNKSTSNTSTALNRGGLHVRSVVFIALNVMCLLAVTCWLLLRKT